MKMTIAQVKSAINSMLKDTTTGNGTFTLTKDEISHLVTKIAFDLTIVGNYNDTLPELDGGEIPTGEIPEEYFSDLIMPIDYDKDGKNTLAPHRISYRPTSYSYPLPEKNFALTMDKVGNKKSFNSLDELSDYLANKIRRLGDSVSVWRYNQKCELLGKYADAALNVAKNAKVFAASTAYGAGESVKESDGATETYVVQTDISSSNAETFASLVTNGTLVKVALSAELDPVTDSATGEAFITQIKTDVEASAFASNEHNINGALQGAYPLTLYVRKGILPPLEVQTLAGAFHEERLAIPATIKVVESFGTYGEENNIMAMLIDPRGAKLFTNQIETDEQPNGEGHFYTIFQYRKETPFYSPNTFVKIYTQKAEA